MQMRLVAILALVGCSCSDKGADSIRLGRPSSSQQQTVGSNAIIVRDGEHWAVGRHVATIGAGLGMATPLEVARALLDGDLRVPVYSLVDEHFELITDAAAWVAAQEGRGRE